MELDFTDEIKAGRPGPKSSAQTPSKPEERKKGSIKINLVLQGHLQTPKKKLKKS